MPMTKREAEELAAQIAREPEGAAYELRGFGRYGRGRWVVYLRHRRTLDDVVLHDPRSWEQYRPLAGRSA